MSKKNWIIISVCVVTTILVGVILTLCLLDDKKDYQVYELELLQPLNNSDSSTAVNRIKENVVKISNRIDEENIIYGTGFFDKSGYLVTNSHVVDIKGDITVTYSDGSVSNAEITSNDILSDIAILSVENVLIKALPLKSTLNLEVTDELYSIGYQLNLEGDATVTKGILSAKRVSSGIEFLQTDAAVNAGGSGGPVINDLGEVLGMVTLASDNATLSFAISSDTLELYINKLINNKNVTYLENDRETNALGTVLKEVGYHTEDIYEEEKYFDRKDNNHKDEDKDNNNNDHESKKDYSIGYNTPAPLKINFKIPTNIDHYFILGKDLTGCKLDISNVDNTKVGIYEVKVVCNENSKTTRVQMEKPMPITVHENKMFDANVELSTNINDYFYVPFEYSNCKLDLSKVDITKGGYYDVYVNCDEANAKNTIIISGTVEPNHIEIPEIIMDETKNNVTSFKQIEGIWYYPGYKDVCERFSIDRNAWYEWYSININPSKGKPFYDMGGGGAVETESQFFNQAKFWLSGNFLVITTSEAQYTLTKIKGEGIFDERYFIGLHC